VAVRLGDAAITVDDLALTEDGMPCSSVSPEAGNSIWTIFVNTAAGAEGPWGGTPPPVVPSSELIAALRAGTGLGDPGKRVLSERAEAGAKACVAGASQSSDLDGCLRWCDVAEQLSVGPGPACKSATKKSATLARAEQAQRDREAAAEQAAGRRACDSATRCFASECSIGDVASAMGILGVELTELMGADPDVAKKVSLIQEACYQDCGARFGVTTADMQQCFIASMNGR
jgi:hypothetical protein